MIEWNHFEIWNYELCQDFCSWFVGIVLSKLVTKMTTSSFQKSFRPNQDGEKGLYIYKLDMLDIFECVICTHQFQGWWEEVQQARCEKSRARKGNIGTAFGLGRPCNSTYVFFRCQKRFMYLLGNQGADALQEQGLQGLEGLRNLCPNIPWQLCHCRKKNPDWVKPAYVPTGNPRGRPKKAVGLAHPTNFERKL